MAVISVLELTKLTAAVKLKLLQPYGHNYILVKTENAPIFLNVNRK